jgi:hypothetical protein
MVDFYLVLYSLNFIHLIFLQIVEECEERFSEAEVEFILEKINTLFPRKMEE